MTTTTTGALIPAGIRTLVFDVLGTVVDETGHHLAPWPDSAQALLSRPGTWPISRIS
jgi:hypothetical protein